MKTVSWILLAVVALLIILGGLGSTGVAYFGDGSNDIIVGGRSLTALQLEPEVVNALRGRRGTAAALGLGFGILLLIVILGPYRRGAVWAWWAILASTAVTGGVILLRVPALGIIQGATSVLGFLLVLAALLLDAGRLSRGKAGAEAEPSEPSGGAAA